MIIACPACATRYAVPDTAIGADGRTVRCAKCRHSWFQEPGETVDQTAVAPPPPQPDVRTETAPAPAEPPRPEPAPVQSQTETSAAAREENIPAAPAETATASAYGEPADVAEPQHVPPPPVAPAWEPARREADSPTDSDNAYGNGRSTFDRAPLFRPRVNRNRMWTLAASLFAAVSIAAIAAVGWYGLPDWMPMGRAAFAEAQPGLVLDFPPTRQDRRTLPNGTEFFGASGTITNVGNSRRSVPQVLILLRDSHERIVYSWVVIPMKRELAPGESITINEAVTDIPKSAKFADIGWKPN